MIGREDQGFSGFIIGGVAGLFASALVAVFAQEALFAVFSVSIFDQMFAAATRAVQSSGKHRFGLP